MLVPRRYSGELWGHGRELAAAYADLGLTRNSVRPADVTVFEIWTAGESDAPGMRGREPVIPETFPKPVFDG
jgi:hypothetical protein